MYLNLLSVDENVLLVCTKLINIIILLPNTGTCCSLKHWLPTGEEVIDAMPGTSFVSLIFLKYLKIFLNRPEELQPFLPFKPFFQDFILYQFTYEFKRLNF